MTNNFQTRRVNEIHTKMIFQGLWENTNSQCSSSITISMIHICSMIKQNFNSFNTTSVCSCNQSCSTFLVHMIRICTFLQQLENWKRFSLWFYITLYSSVSTCQTSDYIVWKSIIKRCWMNLIISITFIHTHKRKRARPYKMLAWK